METNQNLLSSELQIDPIGHSYLSETAKWCNFLAIVGFIASSLLAIGGIFAGTVLSNYNSYSYSSRSAFMGAGFITVVYLIIAVVYFFLSLFLFRFATKMKVALLSTDQDALNNSFLNLKNVYKLLGILTIIYLIFLILAIVVGIGASAFR